MKKSKIISVFALVIIVFVVIAIKTSVLARAESSNVEELAMADDDIKRPLLQASDGSYVCGCTSYTKCSAKCK